MQARLAFEAIRRVVRGPHSSLPMAKRTVTDPPDSSESGATGTAGSALIDNDDTRRRGRETPPSEMSMTRPSVTPAASAWSAALARPSAIAPRRASRCSVSGSLAPSSMLPSRLAPTEAGLPEELSQVVHVSQSDGRSGAGARGSSACLHRPGAGYGRSCPRSSRYSSAAIALSAGRIPRIRARRASYRSSHAQTLGWSEVDKRGETGPGGRNPRWTRRAADRDHGTTSAGHRRPQSQRRHERCTGHGPRHSQ